MFAPTFTSLSEIFGRKFPLLTALSLFTLGSVVCASAPSLAALLIGRVIQGVGGGGIIALTNVIVTDLVPLRERGKWFGAVTMTWAVGTDIGPIIGGVLAKPQRWVSSLSHSLNFSNRIEEIYLLDQHSYMYICVRFYIGRLKIA